MPPDDPRDGYQALEWAPKPTHCLYLTYIPLPNGNVIIKSGQSKEPEIRVRRFGGILIAKVPCGCALSSASSGRQKCDGERHFERTHNAARLSIDIQKELDLPGALFAATPGVLAHIRLRFRRDDKIQAIVDHIERANRSQAG